MVPFVSRALKALLVLAPAAAGATALMTALRGS
jgi:hypothetical protein